MSRITRFGQQLEGYTSNLHKLCDLVFIYLSERLYLVIHLARNLTERLLLIYEGELQGQSRGFKTDKGA